MRANWLTRSSYAFIAVCFSAAASAQDSSNSDLSRYKVIADVALTKAFDTKAEWHFVVTQEPGKARSWGEEPGLIHFCFVRNGKPDCSELPGISPRTNNEISVPITFEVLELAKIVRLSGKPLLLVVGSEFCCGPMVASPTTILWTYRSGSDRFERIFAHFSSHNNNEETRVMTRGPLAGDIIESVQPSGPPYHYRIVVYRLTRSARFVKVPSYRGDTRYGDGDRTAVIDSEIPEILRRLGKSSP